ncbi:MAG: hypothetical protein KGJ80_13185, partial [Chloroflexota bacterium]|nr:hypothetical protein [Chloroflexota bacterium]
MEITLLIVIEVIIVLAVLVAILTFHPESESLGASSKLVTVKPWQKYKGVRGLFRLRNDRRELAKQFKQWSVNAAFPKRVALSDTLPMSAENFAAWVSGLGDKELERFADKVARYCSSVNFDVAWQDDPQLGYAPELKQLVEDSVLIYALGAWHPDSVQSDVPIFLAYRAWRADPDRHKKFGLKLHQVLIECGQVTAPPELFLASEKERKAQAITAICKIADENPAAFRLALRQLAGLPDSPPRATVPVTPSRGKLEHELDTVQTHARQLTNDLDITTQAKANVEKELGAVQTALSRVEERARQLENELSAVKQSLSGAEGRASQLQGTLDLTTRARAESDKQLGEAASRARQLQGNLDVTTKSKAELEKELSTLKLAQRDVEASARQLGSDYDTTLKKQIAFELELTARQDRLQKELGQVKVHANQLENELAALNTYSSHLEDDLQIVAQGKTALKEELGILQTRDSQLEGDLAAATKAQTGLEEELSQVNARVSQLASARDLAAQRQAELEKELGQVKARATQLEGALGIAAQGKAELEKELSVLKVRISQLEGDLGVATQGKARLEKELGEIQARASQLEGEQAVMMRDNAELARRLEILQARASQLEGDLGI